MPRIPATPQVKAFLDLLAWAEGTTRDPLSQDNGYDIIATRSSVGQRFTDYTAHPFTVDRQPLLVDPGPPPLYTTASGRYQLNRETWLDIAATHHLTRFSPEYQDHAALALLAECGAYVLLINNRIEEAIGEASYAWGSLPGVLYSRSEYRINQLLDTYHRFLTNFQD